MPLEIDYAALAAAMSHYDPVEEMLYFFDRETGGVLTVDSETEREARKLDSPNHTDDPLLRLAWYNLWQEGDVGEELPEEEEAAMLDRVEAFLARYLPVPTADPEEGYQDMVDFAATVSDAYLRGQLEGALAGKGAFRRFKVLLADHPAEHSRWFEFKEQRLRERVDDWLRQEGVLPQGRDTPH